MLFIPLVTVMFASYTGPRFYPVPQEQKVKKSKTFRKLSLWYSTDKRVSNSYAVLFVTAEHKHVLRYNISDRKIQGTIIFWKLLRKK